MESRHSARFADACAMRAHSPATPGGQRAVACPVGVLAELGPSAIVNQVGKQENCRLAVSLPVTTEKASMLVAFRLYLPETWIKDRKRHKKTGIPNGIQFQTKPEIALEQTRRARRKVLRAALLRIAVARALSGSASSVRSTSSRSVARFSSLATKSGCSPSIAFSQIASARRSSGSAST